jgi:hypothetical protein
MRFCPVLLSYTAAVVLVLTFEWRSHVKPTSLATVVFTTVSALTDDSAHVRLCANVWC